jgi:ABC-2 type transport system permease protein
MRRYVSLWRQYFIQYAKVRLAYRLDFFLSIATTALATACGIAVVFLMFRRVPRIAGWSFTEILFLYGFSLVPLSLFNMISINLYYFAEQYLVMGKFDQVLLRPLDPLFQVMFEKFRLEAVGDTMLGLFIVATCASKLGLRAGPAEWAFFLLAALCGCALYTAVFLMLTCVSFWMEDRIGVIPPIYNMLAFGRYPLDIYGQFIRFVLSWVVPFGFASFYPSARLLHKDAYRAYSYLMPLVAAAFLFAAIMLWNRGVRNYSSTGT